VILIGHDHGAADKTSRRVLIEQVSLQVQRSGDSHIVVIEKRNVRRAAFEDSDVARARDALIPFHANVVNAGKPLTDVSGFIH
jgi:hypothetical protein